MEHFYKDWERRPSRYCRLQLMTTAFLNGKSHTFFVSSYERIKAKSTFLRLYRQVVRHHGSRKQTLEFEMWETSLGT